MWHQLFIELTALDGDWGVRLAHGDGFGSRVLCITWIKEGSSASGRLFVGDRILSVDGVPCDGLTPYQLEAKIANNKSSTIVIEVFRDDKVNKMTDAMTKSEVISKEEISMQSSTQHFEKTTETSKLQSFIENTADINLNSGLEEHRVNTEVIVEQKQKENEPPSDNLTSEQVVLEQTTQDRLNTDIVQGQSQTNTGLSSQEQSQTTSDPSSEFSQQQPQATPENLPQEQPQPIPEPSLQGLPQTIPEPAPQVSQQQSQIVPEPPQQSSQIVQEQSVQQEPISNHISHEEIDSKTLQQEHLATIPTEESERILPVPENSTENPSPVIERKEIKETLQEIIKEIDKEVIKDFQRSECKSVTTDQSSNIIKQENLAETELKQTASSNFESKSYSSFNVKKISSTGHSLWTPSGIIQKGNDQPFGESLLNSLPTFDNSPIPPIWIPPKVAYTPLPLPDLPDIMPSSGPTDILPPSQQPTPQQKRPATLGLQNGDIKKGIKEPQNPAPNLLSSISGPDMPTCRKLSEDELKKIFTPADDTELISPTTTGRKMYASSYFYSDSKNLYPTVEEQLKLAKKISDSLSSETNKESKGQDMFERRKRKSHKWVHEETRIGDSYSSTTLESRSATVNGQTASEQTMSKTAGKTPLKLVLNPVSMRDWSATKQGFYADHTAALSPEICADLVKDLQQPKGKGAMLFAKRKKKSENWIVDSANRKNPAEAAIGAAPPTPKPTPNIVIPPHAYTGAATSAGKARVVQNQKIEEIQMRLAQPKVKLVKSPWEAALETGSVDTAFQPTPPVFSAYTDPLTPPITATLPTPPLVAEPPPLLMKPSDLTKSQPWESSSSVPMEPVVSKPAPAPAPPAPEPSIYSMERKSNEFNNYNTAARGWGQFNKYYRPVTFSSVS